MLSTEMIASVNRTSDITGNEIDVSERYIRFADHFFLKVSEGEKLEELILGEEKSFYNLCSEETVMNRCVNCLEKNRGSEITLKGKNNHRENEVEMKTKVCDKCKSEVIEDMKEKIDKIRRTTKFNSENGFVIYTTKKSEKDFIEGNYIDEDSLVIAIRFGELSPKYVTRVRNIGEFIRKIQTSYEEGIDDDRIFDCSKCDSKANVSFKRIWFCKDCLRELELGLQKYLDNNEGEIISETI